MICKSYLEIFANISPLAFCKLPFNVTGCVLWRNLLVWCSPTCIFLLLLSLHFLFVFCWVGFFGLFRAEPVAPGSSQARGQIGAAAASLHHSHSSARSELCLQPTPQLTSNTRSLTHWARTGIEPTSSWMLVGFLTRRATMGTPTPTFPFLYYLPP